MAVASSCYLWRSRKQPSNANPPPVTILKPLKGHERGLYENLLSFFRQDYPHFQILFAATRVDDPALAVVSKLRREFPSLDIGLVISDRRIGFNPKVNNLANLSPLIKHELILLSDSDARVMPDFLRRMAATFEDPQVGAATCFFHSAVRGGLWGRLESLAVNSYFLPQAAVAMALGVRFAMGAATMIRWKAFEQAGGFQSLAQHLADDYKLGEAIQEAGWRLELADCAAETQPRDGRGLEHFRHQVRWQSMVRLCHPMGYLSAALLSHGFPWLVLSMLWSGPDMASLKLAALILAAKASATVLIAARLGCRPPWRALILLPISECFLWSSWMAGWRCQKVFWRGQLYQLGEQGGLEPALNATPAVVEP
ncbi:MAG: bacteriohopanetetrol glucosamine biosynthesis glycosyltransferase HpnI [Elusimicrobia bacterium]|nr:bacteriohopanetetrol glucosamine biosynthesis glycosyltransferase HpnI [Elusimicrobiota bacterium]